MKRVFVVTGSGISAESGIPTFRGKDGYWRNLDPTKLATEAAFLGDPKLVWDWYRERRAMIRDSKPNPAHDAVVKLATHSDHFMLLTQNVDDLHARAQSDGQKLRADQIVQIHGDIFVTRCSRCDFRRRDLNDGEEDIPLCPKCGALMRPGVVWFDEELDPHEVRRVEAYLNDGSCEIVLVVGTTAVFEYIVDWTVRAKANGGRLIEVNPESTPLSVHATDCIRKPAAEFLPVWVNQLIGTP